MAEYIEREAVLALKKPFPTSKDSITLYQQYFISPTTVEKIPAADVVPVRQGHWIQREDNDGALIISFVSCSSCHYDWDFETPFCPNCGARMDGDGE